MFRRLTRPRARIAIRSVLIPIVGFAAACGSGIQTASTTVAPVRPEVVAQAPPTSEQSAARPPAPVVEVPEPAPVAAVEAVAAADVLQQVRLSETRSEPALIDELLAISATLTPPDPGGSLQEFVEADLRTLEYDIPVPLNKRVLSFIELFKGRLRVFLQEGLLRGGKYLPMIQDVFRAEGLPLDLAYVPLLESAFKTNALSRAKAKGVWQFMPRTGRENGLQQDWYVDERSDPEKATVAAAKYLRTLHDMFDGDWHLALASYNGGPGRVQRASKSAKSKDFWTISAKNLLPRETRDYVPMILAAVVIAKNPEQYGFTVEPQPQPLAYETVVLPQAVDLGLVAEWAGAAMTDIQTLNPELRRWTTPIKSTGYALKVPVGTAIPVSAGLDQSAGADIADLASFKWHAVKRNETIATVAKKLGVTRADLAESNFLKTTSKLVVSQQLVVPKRAPVVMAARINRSAPAEEEGFAASDTLVAFAAPAADVVVRTVESTPASGAEPKKIIYRVKKGDTLTSIARVFSTDVASIKSWNQIADSKILIGERLTIYSATQ